MLTKQKDILESKLNTFNSIAEGSLVSASWALMETKNILAQAEAEGENIKAQVNFTAVQEASIITAAAETQAEQILARANADAGDILDAADERAAEANSIHHVAVAFKQQVEVEAATIMVAADAKADLASRKFAEFLSQFKEKVSNLSLETAVETGILDLSQVQ
jgi:cell division septum initiation protein DivIVA